MNESNVSEDLVSLLCILDFDLQYMSIPAVTNVRELTDTNVMRLVCNSESGLTCSWVGGQGVCDKCRTCELWRPRLR